MAHVRKLASGRWQTRYRGPDGRERARNFRTKVDAEHYANVIEADKLRGTWVDPRLSRITFAEWVEQVEVGRNVRPTTAARDSASLRNHILPFFRPMKLVAIEPRHVREWLSKMEKKDLAPATVRKAYSILSRILRVAVDDGRLPHSPCRGVSLPTVEPSKRRFLNPTEVDALAHDIDLRFRVLVLTAVYTGLRFGELAALRVSRFDPLRRTLLVAENLVEVSGNLHFGPPKTRSSRRTVTLPRFLVEEIAQHLTAFPDPSDLIFSAPGGGALRRSNFRRRYWIPAVESSIGPPCTFHDLRHTHAALLIAEGLHPKVIQDRMGHSSIRTTLDTYGHLFEGLDVVAAERLDLAYTRNSHETHQHDVEAQGGSSA